MDRRRFLVTVPTLGGIGLAGCSQLGGDGSTPDTATDSTTATTSGAGRQARFEFAQVSVPSAVEANETIRIHVRVTNVGDAVGQTRVRLTTSDGDDTVTVELQPGATETVTLAITGGLPGGEHDITVLETATGASRTTQVAVTPGVVDLPWTQLPGPPGGPVTGIAVSPADPAYIYAQTVTAGLYASTDGGNHWIQGPESEHHGTRNTASPHDPAVARSARGFNRTTDAGRTWYSGVDTHEHQRAPHDHVDGDVADIAYDPFDEDVLYVATTAGLYRTVDQGLTWERTPIGLDTDGRRINRVAVHREREGVVVVPLPDNRLAISDDRGDSWRVVAGTDALPAGGWTRGLVLEARSAVAGYVAVGTDVYRFDGSTVRAVTADPPPLQFLGYDDLALSADDGRVYFVARPASTDDIRQMTVYTYDAGRDTVATLSIPEPASTVATHPTDPATVYLGGWSWVHESRNEGGDWTALAGGFVDRYLSAVGTNPAHPGTIIPGSICSGGVQVSRDHGQTFAWKRSGIPPFHQETRKKHWEEHYVMRVAANGNRAYATTAAGLLVSSDNGESWRLETEVPGHEAHGLDHFHGLAVDPTDPEIVYMGTGLGRHGNSRSDPPSVTRGAPAGVDRPSRIWRSRDGGQSWREITDGFPADVATVVQDIVVSQHDPDVVYAGTNADDYIAVGRGQDGGTGQGIYRSTTAGEEWSQLSTPFANLHGLAEDAGSAEVLYASTPDGVYRSQDTGGSWTRLVGHAAKALLSHPTEPGVVFACVNEYDGYWDLVVSQDRGETWAEADLTIQTGREPDGRAYDGLDYNADYNAGGGGYVIDMAMTPATSHLVAATRGAGLWRCDVSSVES